MQNPAFYCILARKIVRNAVHNAFLNTLTMTPDVATLPLRANMDFIGGKTASVNKVTLLFVDRIAEQRT